MEEKSPKKDDILKANPMENAMRFLKHNPVPEANKEGDNAPKEKASELCISTTQERVCVGNNVPYDFRRPRDHMASDRFGEELAPDAAIWNIYLDEAQAHDRELVESRQRSLDTLLLFAALFSAILTAFLIEAKDLLQQDPADVSVALLLIIAQSQQRVELGLPAPEESTRAITMPDFTPPLSARWVNGIWFMSLGLSLSAALIAMLGKEWLTTFHSSRPRSARRLAFIRQSRLKGLEDWGALHIIALLPTLLHMSLLLFSVGLVVYLWVLDTALAAVLAGVIGVTLAFYIVTGILGTVYEFCPFVTGVSEYTQRAAAALFKLPRKDSITESSVPSIKDLQALVWLSRHSGDPIVVDYAYQSMAGLHLSPYITLNSSQARPNPHSDPKIPDELSLFDHDITINSLLLKIEGRYDDLLVGTLETGSAEPPACRYINAMIAIGSYSGKFSDAPLMHWLNLLDKINKLWTSNLPQRSISGSSFAGVLIAEMDVFRLAVDLLQPRELTRVSVQGTGAIIGFSVEPNSLNLAHKDQHTIDVPPPSTQLNITTDASFLRLIGYLVQWIELSLTLLQVYTKGETNIDPYLVDGLFRAISNGAHDLQHIYSVLGSHNRSDLVSKSRPHILECLNILISLLLQLANDKSESIIQLTEILKTYSHLASLMPQCLSHQKGNSLGHAFGFRDLNSSPPTSRREILYISVRYMMISTGYLCQLLPELTRYPPVFENALTVAYKFTIKDVYHPTEHYGACHAVYQHTCDCIRILGFIGANGSNIELITSAMATSLCFIMLNPMVPDIAATGLYVPPSCFLSFIHVFGRSLLGASTIRGVMEMILQRLRAPSVPLPQLPPEILPFPEPRPSIEYLQQLTRLSGGFLALVRAGSIDEDYVNVIPRGIAYITVIAANRDPALSVDPVELHTPAVPGFLEALSWALPHLLSLEGGRNLYNQFLVAASILLVVACEDPESREKVAHDSGRTKLLVELRDNKDIYLGMISKVEWRRLVNGLALGEVDAEETGSDEGSAEEPNNESDGESIEEPQADAVPNMNEVVIGNTDPNEVEGHGENTLHTSLD